MTGKTASKKSFFVSSSFYGVGEWWGDVLCLAKTEFRHTEMVLVPILQSPTIQNTLTFSDWCEAKICGGWKVQFLKSQKLEKVQAAPTRTRTSRKSSV